MEATHPHPHPAPICAAVHFGLLLRGSLLPSQQSPPFYLGILLLGASSPPNTLQRGTLLFHPTSTKEPHSLLYFPLDFPRLFSPFLVPCCSAVLDPSCVPITCRVGDRLSPLLLLAVAECTIFVFRIGRSSSSVRISIPSFQCQSSAPWKPPHVQLFQKFLLCVCN